MKLPVWIKRQFKKRPRIYIFPTRMGGYFNGLIFIMFLLSVGYNNNLLLIFTLILFALNLMWVIQTHFYLNSLKLESLSIEDGHAGEETTVNLRWKKLPEGSHQWKLQLQNDVIELDLGPLDDSTARVVLPARGLWKFQHLYVRTDRPFGIYRVWVYFPIEVRTHAYPSKVKDPPALRILESQIEGESSTMKKGPHDVWNLGPYEEAESRKISWKHYARTGELVVKEGEELRKSEVLFRFKDSYPEKEKILSEIATQMVMCLKADTSFALETSHNRITSGFGEKHLHLCLRTLALC